MDNLKQDIKFKIYGDTHSFKYKSSNTMCHNTYNLYLLRGDKNIKFNIKISHYDTTIEVGKNRTEIFVKSIADLKRKLTDMFLYEVWKYQREIFRFDFFVSYYVELMVEYEHQKREFYDIQAKKNDELLQEKATIKVYQRDGVGDGGVFDDNFNKAKFENYTTEQKDKLRRVIELKAPGMDGYYCFSQHWFHNEADEDEYGYEEYWSDEVEIGNTKVRDLFFKAPDNAKFIHSAYGFRPDYYKSKEEFQTERERLNKEYRDFMGWQPPLKRVKGVLK